MACHNFDPKIYFSVGLWTYQTRLVTIYGQYYHRSKIKLETNSYWRNWNFRVSAVYFKCMPSNSLKYSCCCWGSSHDTEIVMYYDGRKINLETKICGGKWNSSRGMADIWKIRKIGDKCMDVFLSYFFILFYFFKCLTFRECFAHFSEPWLFTNFDIMGQGLFLRLMKLNLC